MASITIEIECEVDGKVLPPEPDVGIDSLTVEDADVCSVSALKWIAGTVLKPRGHYAHIDILDGLDKASRDIVAANIVEAFRTDIDEAVIGDWL